MVLTITAPLWSDISDRTERKLGVSSARLNFDGVAVELQMSGNDGLTVTSKPWWSQHGWGYVLLVDDFEGTLKWRQMAGTVTKASDPTFVLEGTSAMKLVTGAIAGNGASADIRSIAPRNAVSWQGIEFWWDLTAAADATPRDFYMFWVIQDRWFNYTVTFGIRYLNYDATVQRRKFQYWSSGGAWADFMIPINRQIRIADPMFNYFMLVLERAGAAGYTYRLFGYGAESYNMVGIAGQAGAFGAAEQNITIACTTDAAAATTLYVDAFSLQDRTRGPA